MSRGRVLAAVVLTHLGINVVHGSAHTGAVVPLSVFGTLFVYSVILAAPLVGLVLWRWRPRLGGWLVAASMGAALVFGLVNHFVIAGSDHVSHVAADWRLLFGVTAVLLVVCEAVGAVVGVWAADL
jgi:hypothetical protein